MKLYALLAVFLFLVVVAIAPASSQEVRPGSEAGIKEQAPPGSIATLLERLKTALMKRKAEAYAACFASAYLEKEFGTTEGRAERVKRFLDGLAVSKCSFEEVTVVPVSDRAQVYKVECYRHATLTPYRKPATPDGEGVTEVRSEFYKDSFVIDAKDAANPVIEALKSQVSPERKKAVYAKLVAEDDRQLAQLRPDDKDKRALLLAKKAQHLSVGLGDMEQAEASLREAVKLAGKSSVASLALAGLLTKTGRPQEALDYLHAVAQELQDDELQKAQIDRWIKECETAVQINNKKKAGAPGE